MSHPPRLSFQAAAALHASARPQRARTSAAATPAILTAVRAELVAPLRTGAEVVRSGAGLLSRVATAHVPALARDQRSENPAPQPGLLHSSQVTTLIYELLDAHSDTPELAAELEHEPDWSAHIAYLSALQRYGREVLGQIGTGDGA